MNARDDQGGPDRAWLGLPPRSLVKPSRARVRTIYTMRWPAVTCVLAVVAACARAAQSQMSEYTVMHRIIELERGTVSMTPWHPRALVTIPNTLEAGPHAQYKGIDAMPSFPERTEQSIYQIKVVPGDMRDLSSSESSDLMDNDEGFMTYTKLVRGFRV